MITFFNWPYYFVCQLIRNGGKWWKIDQQIRAQEHEEDVWKERFRGTPKKITRSFADK